MQFSRAELDYADELSADLVGGLNAASYVATIVELGSQCDIVWTSG